MCQGLGVGVGGDGLRAAGGISDKSTGDSQYEGVVTIGGVKPEGLLGGGSIWDEEQLRDLLLPCLLHLLPQDI